MKLLFLLRLVRQSPLGLVRKQFIGHPIALFVLLLLAVARISATGAEKSSLLDTPTPTAEQSIDTEPPPKDFSQKYQVRVSTNAPPAVDSSGNVTNARPEGIHWDLSWGGWNGLYISVTRYSRLKTPRELLGLPPLSSNMNGLHFEQLKMSAKITATLELDGAAYATGGNLDLANGIELRRARLKAAGDCIVILPVSYEIELGYIPNKFNLNKAWISTEHIDYIGYVKAGVFAPPMGLDMLTSSRDLTFMEPASVLQALAPGNAAGIQIGQPFLHQRGTWELGIFGGGVIATEYGNASQDFGNLMGRFTFLVIDHIDPENPGDNRYLHVGMSGSAQYSASSAVQFRSRPESYIATHVIDTGVIDAKTAGTLAAELAYVNGPFTVQGEFLDSRVRENDGEALNFWGFYGAASWYLTGESRPYNPAEGYFKRLVPLRNFNFGKGGAWGAFEVGGRFSYTDLNSGDIHGGSMGLAMGEVNWYLHSHVRWMFDAGAGHVTGGKFDGRLALFQTRIGVDF